MTSLSAVGVVEETPIDRWLAEQADLTAVERFSQHHDAATGPVQARYYRDLLPATAPGPGQQYGFSVDLDACTGCKACVAACHSLNGLDEDETWRAVTRVTGWRDEQPFQQTVTAACHHCVDPACLKGCPVDAYDKDPITGIVRHLDDQCIGCSYCTLTCPYEVPTFNHRLGIVRKCDLCADRLAEGEAPACVQSCPNEAIAIEVVDVAAVVAATRTAVLVPGAPPSSITAPTTTYTSRAGFEHLDVAPTTLDRPAHGHPPLATMLVLTQLAVGAFVTELVLRWTTDRTTGSLPTFDAIVIAAVGVLALAASVLHLGRPLHAYRAVIGLRHSWLSREVVAFGAFTGLAVPYALIVGLGGPIHDPGLLEAAGGVVAAAGLAGVACSVILYAVTRRSSWLAGKVSATFTATAAILGAATVAWATVVAAVVRPGTAAVALDAVPALLLVAAAVAVLKLAGEALVLLNLLRPTAGDGTRRARLLVRDLRPTARVRAGSTALGIALVAVLVGAADLRAPGVLVALATSLALVLLLVGELAERLLFFTTASRPR